MDDRERQQILAAMVELHELLRSWGVELSDYFFIDRPALRLQGYDIALNDRKRQDFCIGTLGEILPWVDHEPTRGFQEVPPPSESSFAAAINDFTARSGLEVHFYAFSEPKYRWRQDYVARLVLPNSIEVRLNTLYGTIRGIAEDMLPYCNDAGVGLEKGVRMLRFIEDMRVAAVRNQDAMALQKADEVLKIFVPLNVEYETRLAGINGGGELSGTPACSGEVSGNVFVVRDILRDVPREPAIIVTSKVTPAFYRYKDFILGLIVDHGGLTSHAAILARELNVPTIVGTLVATERLKTGDTVELDASNGTVRIIAS